MKSSEKFTITEASDNIFEDFFPKEKAKALEFKSDLMMILIAYIQKAGITQKEAARILGVNRSKISALMHYDMDELNEDVLISMLKSLVLDS